MDWLRAKYVLIAAFLALDLALAYEVAVRERWEPTYVALPSEVQVRSLLERACLRLAEPLPDPAEAPPRLLLQPWPVPEAVLQFLVPAEARPGDAGGAGGRVYRWASGRAWHTAEGWLVYAAAGGGEPPGRFGIEEARQAAAAWLQARGVALDGLVPAGPPEYDPRRGGYRVRWVQEAARGLPLLDGELRLVVARAGILELEWRLWRWLEPPQAVPAQVQPAARLLVRGLRPGGWLAALGAEPEACARPRPVSVQLGYRLEPGPGPGGREARLVWRVQSLGAVVDHDAVTGQRLPPGGAVP